jgi:hypothetical protein
LTPVSLCRTDPTGAALPFQHRKEVLNEWLGSLRNASPLPLTAQEVTATWVGAGLGTRYPGVLVTGAEQLQTIEGTATKILVRVTYGPHKRPDGLPDQMWIKGGFAAHREYVGALGVYAGEVRFFNDIAPLYDLPRPASYFGLAQPEPVQGIVALEDLRARGVTFTRATRPLTVELARSGLDALAALTVSRGATNVRGSSV